MKSPTQRKPAVRNGVSALLFSLGAIAATPAMALDVGATLNGVTGTVGNLTASNQNNGGHGNGITSLDGLIGESHETL